jgi:hypothetical protein
MSPLPLSLSLPRWLRRLPLISGLRLLGCWRRPCLLLLFLLLLLLLLPRPELLRLQLRMELAQHILQLAQLRTARLNHLPRRAILLPDSRVRLLPRRLLNSHGLGGLAVL